MKTIVKQIVKPENGIETAIVSDVDFIEGCSYGKSRPGHPEGKIILHIEEVLKNVDEFYGDDPDRSDLRIITLTHDTFKYKVNQKLPKSGANHHGSVAEEFAEKYCHNTKVLAVIKYHDDAYNSWSVGGRRGNWYKAEKRANKLIEELLLVDALDLYVKFYKCDNRTGDKEQENYDWFINLIK